MQLPPLSGAFERVLAKSREVGGAWAEKSRAVQSAAMRALGKFRDRHSPDPIDVLAVTKDRVNHGGMGKADLDTVVERRSEIAREVAAIEAMRVEMETEDQELIVAERVLRRLAEATAAHRRADAGRPVAATSDG